MMWEPADHAHVDPDRVSFVAALRGLGDEGSASDEERSSEPSGEHWQSFGPRDVKRDRLGDEGSASDEEQSSEPSGEHWQSFGPRDVKRDRLGDEESASDEEQSSERSERDQEKRKRDRSANVQLVADRPPRGRRCRPRSQ